VPETTVAQRITRAKRKITDAGIPYRIPADNELGTRLTEVLAVIYLLCNEGYLATAEQAHARDLVDDAEWLASLLHQLMPTEPEVAGLLALIRLHRASRGRPLRSRRWAGAVAGPGSVPVEPGGDRRGDPAADPRRQTAAPRPLPAPSCDRRPSRRGRTLEDTDWEQIVLLYDMLLALAPSPVTRLHRAVALRYSSGPRAAMTELDTLTGALDRYHLYHATRAELLRELGHPDQARTADRLALELTTNPAEQAVLQQRITWT
jgi:RNA polymerase sigma-70 factor (ECF subfamily)